MSVGTNIKALREMFHLDQTELAEKLGVTRESPRNAKSPLPARGGEGVSFSWVIP